MNRLFKRAVGVIALTLGSLLASAQTPAPQLHHFSKGGLSFDYPADLRLAGKSEAAGRQVVLTHGQEGAPDIPDIGSVTGTNYVNKYFGLALTIPSGWIVQDAGLKKQMTEKGKELVTSDDPPTKAELNRSADNTFNLLTLTERPIGSPGPANSMLICGAERAFGVKTDAAYMLALKNTLKYSQVPITIERDVYSEQIGGVAFSVMDFKANYSGVIVSQKYYAHIVKNYALFFIVLYQTPEQLKTLTETLKSATLQ